MKHLAAYLLLQTGGNASPSAADVKELLSTVGIDAEEERLDKLIAELEGKDINEVSSAVPSFVPRAPFLAFAFFENLEKFGFAHPCGVNDC